MRFVKESLIRAPPGRVFAFHELPDALARLTPPWERTRVLSAAPDLRAGSRAVVETRLFGLVPVRWVAEHTAYDPPRMFEDVQVSGLSAHGFTGTESSRTKTVRCCATRLISSRRCGLWEGWPRRS
jgi:ligand-binding SRPBCC domain-containing protein